MSLSIALRAAMTSALALAGACAASGGDAAETKTATPQTPATAPAPVEAQAAEQAPIEASAPVAAVVETVALKGSMAQGGLVFGQTSPGAKVTLDGEAVMVGADGKFVFGFGRDSALTAALVVTFPSGKMERRTVEIADRDFKIERIDGLDQSKVSGFTPEQLAKIDADRVKKKVAREKSHGEADWADGFAWPVTGRVSGFFGSQRILNGEPQNMHSGVDVAASTGTPILAPAAGIVRLADPDMYFEGGLVLLDHGHWVESALMHMSKLNVTAGQRVARGDVIGLVGATGRATGPHMHWSLKWQGRLVDPQLAAGDMPAPPAPPPAPAAAAPISDPAGPSRN